MCISPLGGSKLKSKKAFYLALLLILISFSFLIFHQPILRRAGIFLAPASNEKAEVLILEGTQVITNGGLNVGLRLLSNGRATRLVIVLHEPSKENQAFALQGKYLQLIINELEHLGLEKKRVEVILAPVDGHPVTLKEARFVVAKLSRDGVRSAILLSEGFHTRRSFGVYSHEGGRVGLSVTPYPYFIGYKGDSWWREAQGINEFLIEFFKLTYYLFHGYVPIKSLWYP